MPTDSFDLLACRGLWYRHAVERIVHRNRKCSRWTSDPTWGPIRLVREPRRWCETCSPTERALLGAWLTRHTVLLPSAPSFLVTAQLAGAATFPPTSWVLAALSDGVCLDRPHARCWVAEVNGEVAAWLLRYLRSAGPNDPYRFTVTPSGGTDLLPELVADLWDPASGGPLADPDAALKSALELLAMRS
jgi:hypothetical protein